MASFNKVLLMGNLVRDPELRVTPSGLSVCRITVACSRTVRSEKAEGGSREETTFVDGSANKPSRLRSFSTKGVRFLWKGVCDLTNGRTKPARNEASW